MPALMIVIGLLAQEGIPDILKRDGWRAVDTLADKGEAAKDALEQIARGEDAEAAFYARVALAEIAATAQGEKPVVRAKAFQDAPARQVFEELLQTIKPIVTLDAVPDKRVSLPEGLSTFEAVDRLSGELGLSFTRTREQPWSLTAGASKAPRFVFRHVRVHLDRVRHLQEATFEKEPARGLVIYGWMDNDGEVRWTDRSVNVKVLEAVDDQGTDLRKSARLYDRFGRNYRQDGREFEVRLGAPAVDATGIAKLRFSADLSCAKKVDSFTFEKIVETGKAEKKSGQVTATLKSVEYTGEQCKIDLEIVAKGAVDWPNDLKMIDDEGRPWDSWGGSSGGGSSKWTAQQTYRKPGGAPSGTPASLTFSMVTESYKRTVYVEFKDVPLK